jgi:hypothetical protein
MRGDPPPVFEPTQDLLEQALPPAVARPRVIAMADRGRGARLGWRIAPAACRLEHVQDPSDHPPIVDAGLAPGRIGSRLAQARPDNQNRRAMTRLLISDPRSGG